MARNIVRHGLLTSGAALLMLGVAAPAMAQSPVRVDIPAKSLDVALNELAATARINVLFEPGVVAALRSAPLHANLRPADAVRRLVATTGLEVVEDAGGSVIVRRPVSGTRAQPVKRTELSFVAPPVLAAAPAAQPASFTQDADRAANRGGLEEIIVTAQKREESVQDTPLSISVLGASQLAARGITGLNDLQTGAIPSLRMVPFSARPSTIQISMRGIFSGEPSQISRDTAIGIYVDGVYIGRTQGLGTDLLDLERIEILRGPQGTLFGRNAVGGALNIISKKPTGEFGVELTAGIRNWGGRDAVAHVNLPEFANIKVKLD